MKKYIFKKSDMSNHLCVYGSSFNFNEGEVYPESHFTTHFPDRFELIKEEEVIKTTPVEVKIPYEDVFNPNENMGEVIKTPPPVDVVKNIKDDKNKRKYNKKNK